MDKLMRSVKSKCTPLNPETEVSPNKRMQQVFRVLKPIVSDPRFWQIVYVLQNPLRQFLVFRLPDRLNVPSKLRSIDLLNPNSLDKNTRMRITGYYVFAEAFSYSQTRRKSSSISNMEKGVR